METLFDAFRNKRERVTLGDVQDRPLPIADIEAQKHSRAICLCGLLVVGNVHLGYQPGCGGRHWVATRRAGNKGAPPYFRQISNFNPEMKWANLGGGWALRQLADSTHPHAYRIADADVVAILTDSAHFRAMTVWDVPDVPGGAAQYGMRKA